MHERTRHIATWSGRLAVLIIAVGVFAQPEPESPPGTAEHAVLVDQEAAPEARQDAAKRLIQLSADEQVARLIAGALTPDALERDLLPASLILATIETEPAPPGAVGPILAAACPSMPADMRPALYRAMSRFSTQAIVGALIEAGRQTEQADHLEQIFTSLVRITGRDDLGPVFDAWAAWFESLRWVNELEWRRELARGLAAQRDRLQAAQRLTVNRLVELSRAMYLTMEQGPARSTRLAELLSDELPAMRQLGFDLARRELLAATGAVNGDVGAAAIKLLASADPGVRAQAAALVVQLAPPDAEDAIMLALSRERSPRAAAAMLTGVAKWPNVNATTPVLTWLQRPDETVRPAAASAALALARAGVFSEAQTETMLAAIRVRDDAALVPAEIRLLVVAGDDEDRTRVAAFLHADDAERRRVSAEALTDRTEAVDLVIAAAANDPALFRYAVDMIVRHRPTLAGYDGADALAAPDEAQKNDALARIAGALPLTDLAVAASRVQDASRRAVLLEPRIEAPLPEDDQRPGAVACILLYAQTELDLASPARALAALERIKAEPMPDAGAFNTAMAVALLATGQIETGAAIAAGPAEWIRALEISVDAEHAADLLEEIRARFDEELDDEQREAITALAAAIDQAEQISDAATTEGG